MIRPFLLLIAASIPVSVSPALSQDVDEAGRRYFAEKVHPLLEEHCFKCHGGGKELKGDFRITSREGLMQGGHYGPAHNADDPGASVLLEMVSYQDADHQMPPKGKLPEEALATLAHWMEMGAPYDPALEIKGESTARRGFTVKDEDRAWWAYRPVAKSAPPTVADPEWSANAVDAFVRAQLEREGLSPNPQAAPGALIRRLAYDLTGLPPGTEEVREFEAAFAKDPDAAWAAAVDRLLASPHYGEKWARHWLDLVRYAESNGFERDNPKPHIWRYRDYVVEAFNTNLPYDQFVIEQLAGDEIAEPTMRSLVATGYHRLMQWDDEPADREQHVYDVLADNVQVTSETFLGSSLNCSRCHDHKADPFSQKDYYSFMAFFKGVTHYRTEGTILNWATGEEKTAFAKQRQDGLARLEAEKAALLPQIRAALEKAGVLGEPGTTPVVTLVEDARKGGVDWFYTTEKPSDDWRDVGFVNKSWFKARSGFGHGRPPGSVERTEWKTPEIWLRTTFGLESLPGSLVLDIHHDEDVEVYLNGTLIHEAKGFLTAYETVVLPKTAVDALQTGRNVIAVHCRQSGGGQYIDLALCTGVAKRDSFENLLTGPGLREHATAIRKHGGKDLVAEYKRINDEIDRLRRAEAGLAINAVTETGPDPGPMPVHARGSAHAPGEPMMPGVPAVLASPDSNPKPVATSPVTRDGRTTSGRRLGLAKWIVDPSNPLTARVMVNRIWQHHFGRGIVPSSSDFGKLGEKPTHPELLDWLAGRFVESGWDLKAMHRLILLSRTYRMSSEPGSANLEKDPRNLNFWRYDMRRLTAEELRDSILAVSGNLNRRTGGEWVCPPLPAEVLATASRPGAGWPVARDPADHYRRSLYIHVKRSLRYQMLADFDQADTDTGCAVRFATTVPTQALSLLNSAFVNDQARILAGRMRAEGGNVRERIAAGLLAVLQREAHAEELDHLVALHGDLKSGQGLSEEAALDRVALLALNLNEFIYLD
jgi:hypothetical protein